MHWLIYQTLANKISGTISAKSQLPPGWRSESCAACWVCPASPWGFLFGFFFLIFDGIYCYHQDAGVSRALPLLSLRALPHCDWFAASCDFWWKKSFGESVKIPRKQIHLLIILCVTNTNSCAISVLPYSVPNHCFSGWMALTTYLILGMDFHSHIMQIEVDHSIETCTNLFTSFSLILAWAALILVHTVWLSVLLNAWHWPLACFFLGGSGHVLLLRFIGSSRSGWLKQWRPLMVQYQYILKVKERE